jgi:tetratricopeptide (TPR) repeat protein
MSQEIPELRVEVRMLGKQFLAVTKRSNGQEICTHQFQHDARKPLHQQSLWLLEQSARDSDDTLQQAVSLTSSRPHRPNTARLRPDTAKKAALSFDDLHLGHYGQQLYEYLFGTGEQLQTFLDQNPVYHQGMHLTLAFYPEATALWSLPWEYLHDGQKFFSLDGQIFLSRIPGELNPLALSSVPPPLRVLVAIAGPEDQAEIEIEREISVIQEALRDLQQSGQVWADYLEDVTLSDLERVLREEPYHVLHYIGQGRYNPKQKRGYLCFENTVGGTDPVDAEQLIPLLTANRFPFRMVVLSVCQSAKIASADRSPKDAFDHVAMGLLQANIPAVLAMQSSILDESSIEMFQVLYTGITQGHTLTETVHEARIALRDLDEERSPQYRRFDWGIPALYLRSHAPLINPQAPPITPNLIQKQQGQDIYGLLLPRTFVGRRAELLRMRRSLRQHIPIIYLQGPAGIGKSALAAKFIHRPGVELDGVLVIHCQNLRHAIEALGKLADFWSYQGKVGHVEASALLLNAQLDPVDRAHRAIQMIGEQRYLIVFDNFDAWLTSANSEQAPDLTEETRSAEPPALRPSSKRAFRLGDETMRGIIRGLTMTYSNVTFLFTAERRWEELDTLPEENVLELHLEALTQRQALQLVNTLPRLRQTELEHKPALLGGHPHTLLLLDRWLSNVRAIKPNNPLFMQPNGERQDYLIDQLLAHLPSREREALIAMSILKRAFYTDTLNKIAATGSKRARALLRKWGNLSLIQTHDTKDQTRPNGEDKSYYTFHPTVRQRLLRHLNARRFRTVHARAAAYYGAPFLEEARRRVVGRRSVTWSDEQIEWLARSGEGILGMWIRQTGNLQQAHRAMERALAWQYHLGRAGQTQEASEIVEAVIPVLDRWGRRDEATALLHHKVTMLAGEMRAKALMNLAARMLHEKRFEAALSVYDNAYKAFATLNNKSYVAITLYCIGEVYQEMQAYAQAIEKSEAALHIQRHIDDKIGQANTLCQLANLYLIQEDYNRALTLSQTAENLARKLNNDQALARALHLQGLIFTNTQRSIEAIDRFMKSIEVASRLGNENRTADSMLELGKLLLSLGQLDQATSALKEALKIHRRLRNPKMGIALEMLGNVNERQGKLETALEQYQQARRIYQGNLPTYLPAIRQHIQQLRRKLQDQGR